MRVFWQLPKQNHCKLHKQLCYGVTQVNIWPRSGWLVAWQKLNGRTFVAQTRGWLTWLKVRSKNFWQEITFAQKVQFAVLASKKLIINSNCYQNLLWHSLLIWTVSKSFAKENSPEKLYSKTGRRMWHYTHKPKAFSYKTARKYL